MKVAYKDNALEALEQAPAEVRRAFFKQVKLLEQNLRHPSLRAKKYDEAHHLWQARVNRDWRFYFLIAAGIYVIVTITPHLK
ncbi:MAG: hypothetical protein M3Y27_22845 [Acidobacteriota bacterium]|nr:hypothetical protein [Acidobacteriota bacterium]